MSLNSSESLHLRLSAIRFAAEDINVYEFTSSDGAELPPFEAGAHVDIEVDGGLVRQYSLCNDPAERHRYEIAVLRQASGRGGSVRLHDTARCGQMFKISRPRNLFPLDSQAKAHRLVAGGIGITPIVSMVHALERLGQPYVLHYGARSASRMAFKAQLQGMARCGRVVFHADEGPDANPLDVSRVLAELQPGEHVYCCGPQGLIDAVSSAMSSREHGLLHVERFAAVPVSAASANAENDEFIVELASSGKRIRIAPGVSIAIALQNEGVYVPTSCEQGICGACQIGFLSGTPDHRDLVLLDDERKSYLMACCARSFTPELVLDL